jgi:signal transduction histidine kinase
MTERRVQIGAVVGAVVGLSMVWYLVNTLWVQGWSMHLIHLVAILAAALVTLAASVIVVTVVIRYRRVLEEKNQELERLAAIGEIFAQIAHCQKNLLNGRRGPCTSAIWRWPRATGMNSARDGACCTAAFGASRG